MTVDGDNDGIDFKPFFDLVVGVLFILLILIAAQMFFAQWQGQTAQETEKVRSEQAKRMERRSEANRFLDDLASDLIRAGFSADVDRSGLAIVFPTRELLGQQATPGCNRPVLERQASARAARTLLRRLACVSAAGSTAQGCAYGVGSAIMTAGLQMPAAGPGATPTPTHRAAAIEIAASLFSAEPDLLGLRTPNGALMVTPEFSVSAHGAAASAAEACGLLRLDFPLLTTP